MAIGSLQPLFNNICIRVGGCYGDLFHLSFKFYLIYGEYDVCFSLNSYDFGRMVRESSIFYQASTFQLFRKIFIFKLYIKFYMKLDLLFEHDPIIKKILTNIVLKNNLEKDFFERMINVNEEIGIESLLKFYIKSGLVETR